MKLINDNLWSNESNLCKILSFIAFNRIKEIYKALRPYFQSQEIKKRKNGLSLYLIVGTNKTIRRSFVLPKPKASNLYLPKREIL